MSGQLYAFLVGINRYAPGSGVSNLKGCVNDVENMQSFLKKHFAHRFTKHGADQQIKILTDADAKRAQIIKTFGSHLGKAQAGDIALFYYSGHGSYENTSPEFEHLDSIKRNETLVCHDSRMPGKYDLADKELAVLLSRIDDGVQKVVILDSCHSGSATRSDAASIKGARQTPARHDEGKDYKRPLDSYLLPNDKFYREQQVGKVHIPLSKHILLSACTRHQTALEVGERKEDKAGNTTIQRQGLFTSQLLQKLEEYDCKISYRDLFSITRSIVNKERQKQTPQVTAIMGFDADQHFLDFNINHEQYFDVEWKWNADHHRFEWQLNRGAVHGMPITSGEINEIQLKIYEEQELINGNAKGKEVGIKEVNIDFSSINLPEPQPDELQYYKASISNLPVRNKLFVHLRAETVTEKTKFQEFYKDYESPFIHFTDSSKGAKYEISIENGDILVKHIATQKIIQGARGLQAWGVDEMVSVLNYIEKWERIKGLEKRADYLSEGEVDMKFRLGNGPDAYIFPSNTDSINVDIEPLDDAGMDWSEVPFDLNIQNNSDQKLHVLLLVLNRKFEIIEWDTKELLPNSSPIEFIENTFTISDPKLSESVDIFKIIVSTQELVPVYFTQEPEIKLGKILLEKTKRDLGKRKGQKSKKADWFTKTYTITTSRNTKAIGAKTQTVNGLQFNQNENFQAQLSFNSIQNYNKSVNPLNSILDVFEGTDIEVLDFSKTKGAADKSIVTLSNIQSNETLETKPLEITLKDESIGNGELFIPVTHDGEFFIPFGEVKADEEGHPSISIHHLPDQPDEGRRNVGRALKFCVLKTVKKEADIFQLRWVDYKSEAEEKRTKDKLEDKIQNAQKILLLIHGIIGDTKVMAEEAEFAILEKGYDLVLTFDYENLSTDIDKIAEEFEKCLREEAGFNTNDGKTLHIVAHSMGGLISRHVVEKLWKDNGVVDRLVMFGTPNGGSRFGKLPKAKKFFGYALGFALNFLPGHVKSALEKIQELAEYVPDQYKPNILNTLEMMDTGSDFIKELAKTTKIENTEYFIVAGDITAYQVDQKNSWVGRFLEKVEVGIGKVVYYGKPNDIAVGSDDILDVSFVPDDHKTIIVGHHLNYFVNEPSVEKWQEWIG